MSPWFLLFLGVHLFLVHNPFAKSHRFSQLRVAGYVDDARRRSNLFVLFLEGRWSLVGIRRSPRAVPTRKFFFLNEILLLILRPFLDPVYGVCEHPGHE